MANEPDNIVLVYLRRLDEKVDRIMADVSDIKACLDRIKRRLDLVELPH